MPASNGQTAIEMMVRMEKKGKLLPVLTFLAVCLEILHWERQGMLVNRSLLVVWFCFF